MEDIKKFYAILLVVLISSASIGLFIFGKVISPSKNRLHEPSNFNYPPYFDDLPNQKLNEDTSLLDILDLDNYASDPESDYLTYLIESNSHPECNIIIDNDNKIDIIPEHDYFDGIYCKLFFSLNKPNSLIIYSLNHLLLLELFFLISNSTM